MHACLGLARKSTPMRRLPLFSLLCPSENCQSLRIASLDIGRHHRPGRMATGRKMRSSAVDEAIGHGWIADRHYVQSIGKKFLQNLFDCSRGQSFAWQCNSSNVCTNHIPYHVYDSKGHGPWFSDHQSRISMRDGLRNQVCAFDFKCHTMHVNKSKAQFPSLGQGTRYAC